MNKLRKLSFHVNAGHNRTTFKPPASATRKLSECIKVLPDNLLNSDGSTKSNDQKKRKSGFENKKGNRITKVILREICVFLVKINITFSFNKLISNGMKLNQVEN